MNNKQEVFHTLWPWDTKRLTWTNKRCVGMLQVMKLWSRWHMIFSSFAAICSHTQIIFKQQWHTIMIQNEIFTIWSKTHHIHFKTHTWLSVWNISDIFWTDAMYFFTESLTQMLFSSHLSVLSKEPVLVTTLHSQQGVFMLLFQLDHLLFQRSVYALYTSGGGTRVWRRTQLCTPSSSSWFSKLREV